jgi:hypothetical protein
VDYILGKELLLEINKIYAPDGMPSIIKGVRLNYQKGSYGIGIEI